MYVVIVEIIHRIYSMKSTINLDDKLYKKVQEHCKMKGYTVNGLIRVMLIEKVCEPLE